MGIFKRKTEARADGEAQYEDSLLRALLGGAVIDKKVAMQIPTLASAIRLQADIVASTPIVLYREGDDNTEAVAGDIRTRLLNDDTGDTLNANEFWRAMISDYFLGKGGYAYIHKEQGKFKSLHYVDESFISISTNTDPIFKDYDVLVNGTTYKPFNFVKILRNSKDGASGTPITEEHSKVLDVVYHSWLFETSLVKKGGNKKGFLRSEHKLGDSEIKALKDAYKKLYGNGEENVVVLNKGVEFKESSNSSVEMQLNENKVTNSDEIAKLLRTSNRIISGAATEQEISAYVKLTIIPLLKLIECALNRDLLLEKEKGSYYFAFDTKELLKGNMLDRYKAYEIGVRGGWLTRNEVRYREDDESIDGMDIISMSLADVIYDPVTGKYFTPNTKEVIDTKLAVKGGEEE